MQACAAGRRRRGRRARLSLGTSSASCCAWHDSNPSPGGGCSAAPALRPEVDVRLGSDGQPVVELVRGVLPEVHVDRDLESLARDRAADRATRSWLRPRVDEARRVLDAVRQRQETLLLVATAAVRHQRGWLAGGEEGPRTLTMTALAESSGSRRARCRVPSLEALDTPRGVLTLRSLFRGEGPAPGVDRTDARARVGALVAAEDPAAPLSDDAIAERLGGEELRLRHRRQVPPRTRPRELVRAAGPRGRPAGWSRSVPGRHALSPKACALSLCPERGSGIGSTGGSGPGRVPRMRTVRFEVAYDGTRFHGWQRRDGFDGVQQSLEEGLAALLDDVVVVHGAGRTDTGVHGLRQVAHAQVATRLDDDRLRHALNAHLVEGVVVNRLGPAARTSRAFRRVGSISVSRPDGALPAAHRAGAHFVRDPLDLQAMRMAATALVGTRLRGNGNTGSPRHSTVRTVHGVRVLARRGGLGLVVKGNGFLYNMVRNIAGTLLDWGAGD